MNLEEVATDKAEGEKKAGQEHLSGLARVALIVTWARSSVGPR